MRFRRVVAVGAGVTAASLGASFFSEHYSQQVLRHVCSRSKFEFSCDSASGRLFWNREITLTNLSVKNADSSFVLHAGTFKARTSMWGLLFGMSRFFKQVDASDMSVDCTDSSSRQVRSCRRLVARLDLRLRNANIYLGQRGSERGVHFDLEAFDSGRYGISLKRLLTHANVQGKLDGNGIRFESYEERTDTPLPQLPGLARMSDVSEGAKFVILHELNDGILPKERYWGGRIDGRTIENLAHFFGVPVAVPRRKTKKMRKVVKRRIVDRDGNERFEEVKSSPAPPSITELASPAPPPPPPMTGYVEFSSRYFKGKPFDYHLLVRWRELSMQRFLAKDGTSDEAEKLLIFLKQLVDSRPNWDFRAHVHRTSQYVLESDRSKELQAIMKIVEAIFVSE